MALTIQPEPAHPVVSLVINGQVIASSEASVAAGGQATLDSDQISSGKTGKLLEIIVSSSIPFKVVLQTVLNGVATSRITWFAFSGAWDWKSPAKNLIQVAQSATAGFDGFRVVIENLDLDRAADVYSTAIYDEE